MPPRRKSGEEADEESIEKDVIESIIEELREEIRRNQNTLPNPRQNPEFYEKLLTLIEDPNIRMSQKRLAELLGVSYNLLRNRISTYRKMLEQGEIPGTPQPVDIAEEKSLSPSLERIVVSRLQKHFGVRIDRLTLDYIDKIIKCGTVVVEEFGPWCRENGMDYHECVKKAMQFFVENRDEIESLRRRLGALKAVAMALLYLNREKIARLAVLEAVRQAIVEAVERNPDALEYITELVDEIIEGEILG